MDIEAMQETIEKDPMESVEELLLARWIDQELIPKMVKEPTNENRLQDILLSAREKQTAIPIVSVGCQPIAEVAGNNEQIIGIASELSTKDTARPTKWAKGIASFQKALSSFSIHSHIFLSLSDIELLAQTIDNPEEKDMVDSTRIQENIETLTQLIQKNGGNASSFSHSECLIHSAEVKDLNSLIQKLLPNWKGEKLTHTLEGDGTEDLPNALYDADPVLLPRILISKEEQSALIWLDMMSDLATQDHLQLRNSIIRNLPHTPLVSPVSNGGKWDAAPDPVTRFRDRFEFINLLLDIDNFNGKDRTDWLERVQNTVTDTTITHFLNSLGIEGNVFDMDSRIRAIRLTEFLGDSTFSLNKTKEFEADGTRLKNIIANITGVSAKQVFIQLNEGSIKVNGEKVSDINFVPQPGDMINVGKKTVIQVT
ncbi:MAG: hypothetical protein US24_C0037G0001 [candidate division WS6 bacterium GW2011_GWC2_36_7]|uniref:Uncharacterized protein n=1 Tax=candidate division WS6 bacterium GW2011_GWC2_36_7 TaxID=1619091 RepID=A0A0G0F0B6_9BACT|nr:MAG: hypothetical protein US24_C0037G0001 [candidate division WS6 bacterium GW2011_GWC2_36_7]